MVEGIWVVNHRPLSKITYMLITNPQGSYLSVTTFHRLFKGATPRFVAIIMRCLQELLTIMLIKII